MIPFQKTGIGGKYMEFPVDFQYKLYVNILEEVMFKRDIYIWFNGHILIYFIPFKQFPRELL